MPTEAILDSRFAALPPLIRDATNPNASRDQIRHFLRVGNPRLPCRYERTR